MSIVIYVSRCFWARDNVVVRTVYTTLHASTAENRENASEKLLSAAESKVVYSTTFSFFPPIVKNEENEFIESVLFLIKNHTLLITSPSPTLNYNFGSQLTEVTFIDKSEYYRQ